jgi:hypothetical protein
LSKGTILEIVFMTTALTRRLSLSLLLLACNTIGCGGPDSSIELVLRNHLDRYPKMEPQDVYKLIYQASLGNEHLMTDTSALREYLLDELKAVEAPTMEPSTEALTPDGELVRLNLRPFKSAHGNPEELLKAMLETARTFKKSERQLEAWLRAIEQRGTETAFFQRMRRERYPSVHHSDAYEAAYKPAYRVILKKLLSTSNH